MPCNPPTPFPSQQPHQPHTAPAVLRLVYRPTATRSRLRPSADIFYSPSGLSTLNCIHAFARCDVKRAVPCSVNSSGRSSSSKVIHIVPNRAPEHAMHNTSLVQSTSLTSHQRMGGQSAPGALNGQALVNVQSARAVMRLGVPRGEQSRQDGNAQQQPSLQQLRWHCLCLHWQSSL